MWPDLQLCCSGGSWRNEMEFLHNICTTGLVMSIKEKPVYTNELIACTGTGRFFCSDEETLQHLWLLCCEVYGSTSCLSPVSGTSGNEGISSHFLPVYFIIVLNSFPLYFFFCVTLYCFSRLLPSCFELYTLILHFLPFTLSLSSAPPRFSLPRFISLLLPCLSVTGFTFISPPPPSLPLCLSLSLVWWQRCDMIWFNFFSSSASP